MRFRPTITDPIEKICDEADTAFAVLFIGRDHGVTPQAMGCIKEVIALSENVDDPVAKKVYDTFSMVKEHGDKVWDSQERFDRLKDCCVTVRDICFKDWHHNEWMEARPSWV